MSYFLDQKKKSGNKEEEIETPLSSRVEKMNPTAKSLLGFPAFAGDAVYNVGKHLKNKFSE
jgi:hypothetical protein